MKAPRIVACVMAGGEGVRLRPFTLEQPKPALPIGAGVRIIDFVLSNLRNSGIRRIFVLLQYKPHVLLAHLRHRWSSDGRPADERIEPVLPEWLASGRAFEGTAHAVHECLALLERCDPELVAVFAADHVYRMDVRQMAAFHLASAADVTIAALPVPLAQAREFGVLRCDVQSRIVGFEEKPDAPVSMPGDPSRALVSMGNYLFRPAVLREALEQAVARGEQDFGRHVLPRLIRSHRVYAYDFLSNAVPGVGSHEQAGYWRDVGTVEAYLAARRDVDGTQPVLRLDNPAWPIHGQCPPGWEPSFTRLDAAQAAATARCCNRRIAGRSPNGSRPTEPPCDRPAPRAAARDDPRWGAAVCSQVRPLPTRRAGRRAAPHASPIGCEAEAEP